MASLYELTGQYKSLFAQLDDVEPDSEEENLLLDAITSVENDITNKAGAYAVIMRNKQAEADALKAEIKRLTAKKDSAENVIDRLKKNMLLCMAQAGASSLSTPIGTWKTAMNPWRTEVIDPDKVPEEFREPQPDKINKLGALNRFKETGEIPDGFEFRQDMGVRFK